MQQGEGGPLFIVYIGLGESVDFYSLGKGLRLFTTLFRVYKFTVYGGPGDPPAGQGTVKVYKSS